MVSNTDLYDLLYVIFWLYWWCYILFYWYMIFMYPSVLFWLQWTLVCDGEWKVHIAKFSLLVGSIFGYLLMGAMADWYVNKICMMVMIIYIYIYNTYSEPCQVGPYPSAAGVRAVRAGVRVSRGVFRGYGHVQHTALLWRFLSGGHQIVPLCPEWVLFS